MKLSNSIKHTTKAVKNFEIGISDLEIEIKEKNCNLADANDIDLLFRVFHVYTQILSFLATPSNKIQQQLAQS